MLWRELTFLAALWKANLLAAMEYRAAFLSQALGMMLNDAVYFIFWVLFFQRFQEVRGWGLNDIFLLYGIVATSFGLSVYLFGNVTVLSEVISSGRLDYYLSLPRPVLLHVLASSSHTSGLGDFAYGLLTFVVAGRLDLEAWLRYAAGVLLSSLIFLSFLVLAHSLTFWIGNAQLLASQVFNALVTFSIYPASLFEGTARFLLFTLLPASLVGAVPAELVTAFSWVRLAQLLAAAALFLALALLSFYRGLRRYESGSAIQIQSL